MSISILNLGLCLLFPFCLLGQELENTEPIASFFSPAKPEPIDDAPAPPSSSKDGYTINYNTVSIVEYIRFASKICGINFIFNEQELDFTITVVSDAPISPQNVMGTLVQTLRINEFELLEQDGNLVIHKAVGVRQLATIVTEPGQEKNAPIVTRIFRISYAKVDSIAAVIRPMISNAAILETSPDTHQLIVTDVTTNVDKVAELIEILDSPHNLLEMKTYTPLHNSPQTLVELCNQIMAPIALGHPFTMVAQPLANSIFIVSTPDLIGKALATLQNLDVPPRADLIEQKRLQGENIFVYKAMHRPSDDLLRGLLEIAQNLKGAGMPEGDLIATIDSGRVVRETNSLLFVGPREGIVKLQEFLQILDVAPKEGEIKHSFFVYKPQYRSASDIERALKEMASNLQGAKGIDESLIEMLVSVKINTATNTLVFTGEETQFSQVKELLATIDLSTGQKGKNNFFIYKLHNASYRDLQSSLENFAKSLNKSNVNDEGIVQAIEEMKYIPTTHSILISGQDSALKKLQELIPMFDSGIAPLPASNQFYIYKPKVQRGDLLVNSIKELTADLKSDAFSDPAFLRALESLKFVKTTNSLLFTGDSASLARLDALLATLDVPSSEKLAGKTFFLYTPPTASKEQTESYLNQLASSLDRKNEAQLIDAIRSMKWIEASTSFLFQGTDAGIARLKETLAQPAPEKNFFLYKLQNASIHLIEEDLDQLTKNLKTTGITDHKVLQVLEQIRYVKETNSLLLIGDPAAIEEVKKLIAKYDVPGTPVPVNTDFFMYKPQHRPAAELETSLQDVAASLKQAGLADPPFLQTIHSAKYVATTNSIIFTGNKEAIHKIQTLLVDIDTPPSTHAPIQHVGKTTFLLYKLKHAGGPQIVTSIQTMEADLKKSGNGDKAFLSALASMKYVKETNSLLFTGTEEALLKVEALVTTFDVTSLAPPTMEKTALAPTSTNFFLYKPHGLAGPELEKVIQDFSENLKLSGLSDPDLFNAIISMRWIEKTQALIFAGTPKALDQVKELLREFDVSAAPSSSEMPIPLNDTTNFLVYKLQFHKGDEIQGALRQIAKDLETNNAPISANLLNAIQSIQWLDMTNSLLCSGEQETLVRLKELIKNLDIPLKQVFIEILVIETSLTNALNFGLEWGGNYKFNDKFGASTYNTTPPANSQIPFPDSFITNLGKLAPPAAPTPIGNLPANAGFDLGVIGEVIKHNGQTFLTLGSLLSALQTDTETTIVNTPKILAQDGRTSTFFSGSNIPFTGSFVNNTQSGATIQTSNLEYRDIGLNLTITPVLGNSDIVTLDINLDREQTAADITASQINFSNQTANGIVTSKTTMQTTVHVPDRNFLILSGFVNNSTTKQKAGIPCLGGLPLIGAAFSQSNDTVSAQNIVIFLRPYILNSIDDMRRVTAEQEDFFRDQSATPFLEHNYDESIELIKTIDDE